MSTTLTSFCSPTPLPSLPLRKCVLYYASERHTATTTCTTGRVLGWAGLGVPGEEGRKTKETFHFPKEIWIFVPFFSGRERKEGMEGPSKNFGLPKATALIEGHRKGEEKKKFPLPPSSLLLTPPVASQKKYIVKKVSSFLPSFLPSFLSSFLPCEGCVWHAFCVWVWKKGRRKRVPPIQFSSLLCISLSLSRYGFFPKHAHPNFAYKEYVDRNCFFHISESVFERQKEEDKGTCGKSLFVCAMFETSEWKRTEFCSPAPFPQTCPCLLWLVRLSLSFYFLGKDIVSTT